MKTLLLIVFWGGLLGVAVFFAFRDFDPSSVSIHGWIALGLGSVLSLVVGGGLMALSFYSARAGYDDRVETEMDEKED